MAPSFCSLTTQDSQRMIPLADASLHLALPQNPSFLRSSKFMWSFLVFVLFGKLSWEWLLVSLGYSGHIRCWASLCAHNGHAASLCRMLPPTLQLLSLLLCFLGKFHWQNVQLFWFPTLFCLVCYVAVVVLLLNLHVLRVKAHMSLLRRLRDWRKMVRFCASIHLCSSFCTSESSCSSVESVFWDSEHVVLLLIVQGFFNRLLWRANSPSVQVSFSVQIVPVQCLVLHGLLCKEQCQCSQSSVSSGVFYNNVTHNQRI